MTRGDIILGVAKWKLNELSAEDIGKLIEELYRKYEIMFKMGCDLRDAPFFGPLGTHIITSLNSDRPFWDELCKN